MDSSQDTPTERSSQRTDSESAIAATPQQTPNDEFQMPNPASQTPQTPNHANRTPQTPNPASRTPQTPSRTPQTPNPFTSPLPSTSPFPQSSPFPASPLPPSPMDGARKRLRPAGKRHRYHAESFQFCNVKLYNSYINMECCQHQPSPRPDQDTSLKRAQLPAPQDCC